MKTYIFLLILSVGFSALGQPTTFNQKYGFGYPAAIIQGIVGNGDSIIISGFVAAPFHPYPNRSFIGVVKQNGDMEYFQILDTTDKDYWIYPASLTKSNFSKYYFTSGVYLEKYAANLGYARAFLWKLDENLDTVYTKHYFPMIPTDELMVENHVEYSPDTLALLCTLWKYDSQGNFYDGDLILILTDSLGNELKRVQYGEANYRNDAISLVRCDNGFLVAGWKLRRFNDNGLWKEERQPNILLFNTNGDIIKSYNTPSLDYRISRWAIPTSDNAYVFCGAKVYNVHNPTSAPNQTEELYKGYIAKLNSNFYKVWGLSFGDSTYVSGFSKIIEAHNGDYIAVGRDGITYETVGIDTTIVDSFMTVGWIIRVSPSGQKIWERRHKVVYGSSCTNLLGDIYEQADGSLVMSGVAYDDVPSPITTYAWLIKTDSFGCLVPGCQTVGIAPSTHIADHIKLYPNPAQSELYLYFHTEKQPTGTSFRIWDMQGQEMIANTPLLNSATHILRVQDWAKGLYFVEIRDKEGNVYTEKFVKE